MINTAYTVRSLQSVSFIVTLALLFWAMGFPLMLKNAEAASITNASDTISNSAPSALANHTITFTTPNGLSTGQTFTVTFPTGFATGSVAVGDIDLSVGAADQTLAGAAGAGTWGFSLASTTFTFTTPTDGGVASSTEIIVLIGTNAAGGANQITNPSATSSYQIDIAGTMQDSGQVRVAIIEQVTVTAVVNTNLTFTISGVNQGLTVNGGATTTSAASTATALPFGTLSPNVSKVLAQDLTVATNASNGFVVTVEQTGNLLSSTGADIDGFIDGAYTNSPVAWTAPSRAIGNENTWGHWGLTSEDDLNTNEFGTDLWVAASTTPRQVFENNTPSDGTTANIGATRVGYQVQISSLQEAGDDYNTTIRYIATPTF